MGQDGAAERSGLLGCTAPEGKRTSHDEAFLAALLNEPDDGVTRLVYADWLEERGAPRGEYLRLLARLDGPVGRGLRVRLRDRLRALRARIATAWADAVDRTRLGFGGVYQEADFNEAVHDADFLDGEVIPSREALRGWQYLRLYPEGTVLSVCSTGTPAQVWRWLTREDADRIGFARGEYTLRGDELSFTAGSRHGSVSYSGTVGRRSLSLKWHRHINGRRGKYAVGFVEQPAGSTAG